MAIQLSSSPLAASLVRVQSPAQRSASLQAPAAQSLNPLQVDKSRLAAPPQEAGRAAAYRSIESVSEQQQTRLQLQLTTREGDEITLSFNRLQSFSANRFELYDGAGRVRTEDLEASLSSRLDIRVEGELNAAEQGALDRLLQSIEQVADSFFNDAPGSAVDAALSGLAFDTDLLSELSLNLSLRSTAEYIKVAGGGPGPLTVPQGPSADLWAELINGLAEQRRTLVQSAGEVLQPVSATRLVTELLPAALAARGYETA